MTLRCRALVLLLAMAWQALAWLSPAQLDRQAGLVAHMLVHAQALDHHHQADPALQLDDDGQPPPHQHAHQAVQAPGLAPTSGLVAAEPATAVLVARVPTGHPPVYPDGPLRPPQTTQQPA